MRSAQPPIVDRAGWQQARDDLLAAEKEYTKAGDRLAAQRRRLPMTPVGEYVFTGEDGPVTLRQLFGDASQLVVQHFMFDPEWDAGCPSCSMFADNMPPTIHFGPYGMAFARISRAPIGKLRAYRQRMGWPEPWVSSYHNDFNADWGWTVDGGEVPGVSCYLRSDDDVYLTYTTSGRGVEPLMSFPGFLDRVVYGRQETWEDSPEGWPQQNPYQRNARRDEY